MKEETNEGRNERRNEWRTGEWKKGVTIEWKNNRTERKKEYRTNKRKIEERKKERKKAEIVAFYIWFVNHYLSLSIIPTVIIFQLEVCPSKVISLRQEIVPKTISDINQTASEEVSSKDILWSARCSEVSSRITAHPWPYLKQILGGQGTNVRWVKDFPARLPLHRANHLQTSSTSTTHQHAKTSVHSGGGAGGWGCPMAKPTGSARVACRECRTIHRAGLESVGMRSASG